LLIQRPIVCHSSIVIRKSRRPVIVTGRSAPTCYFAREHPPILLLLKGLCTMHLRSGGVQRRPLAQYLHSQENVITQFAKLDEVNVLASRADWAWPEALRRVFEPRGVNLLIAGSAGEFVDIIRQKRIKTTIVDTKPDAGGLVTVRIIRMDYPLIPCILLTSQAGSTVLGEALRLGVFSVIDKPVDMEILRQQLNRLFIKRYNSDIFG